MVAAYTELHPNVTVESICPPKALGRRADQLRREGRLPDVFMANNVPLYVANGWLADLTDLVASDPDWENAPGSHDGVTYDGTVLGCRLPSSSWATSSIRICTRRPT
jgi:ABC-type glycerol-3-phosphate transport system substrate-binding protein